MKSVILAGWGAYNSPLEQFATERNIPILLTWRAMDLLPEDSPIYCGRPGMIGQPVANWMIQNCEMLLALGVRLDPDTIAYKPALFAPQADKIIVDIDEHELDKHQFPCEKIGSKVGNYLKTSGGIRGDVEWIKHCRNLYLKYPVIRPDHKMPKDYVDYYAFYDAVSNLATNDDVIGYGSSGIGIQILMQSWKVKRGQRVCNSSTMGAMGSWVGAIGLAKASGKRVLCFVGDGGFSINTPELDLIKRYKLPIKIFVFDNGGYGSIRATSKRHFDGRDISGGFVPYNFGLRMIHSHNLIEDIQNFLESGDTVIGVQCSPDQTPDYRCNGSLTDMDNIPEELCQTKQ